MYAILNLVRKPILLGTDTEEQEFTIILDTSLIQNQKERKQEDLPSDDEGEESDQKSKGNADPKGGNKQTQSKLEKEREKFNKLQELEKQQRELTRMIQEIKGEGKTSEKDKPKENKDDNKETSEEEKTIKIFAKVLDMWQKKHKDEDEDKTDDIARADKIMKEKGMSKHPTFSILPKGFGEKSFF